MAAFEAMVVSAHLPNLTMAFRVRSGEAPLAGGIYRIERIRSATEEDQASFKQVEADDVCPLCDREED